VAGAEMLAQEARRRRKMGGGLYFYRCKDDIYKFLRKSDKLDDIGVANFFPTMANWVKPVYAKLDTEICRNCTARIFAECHVNLPNGQARSPLLNPLPQAGEEANEKGNI
jgi:SulP family sulfate permease